ncbi:MAG TPA: Xaa-Pro peptidase family protein [Anaerolineae bacterium]|nr:Xaa-Pro peptidase family protein [Anaerolineae bacterium]
MTQQRIAKLLQLAAPAQLDAVAIMPGPNMQYFTDLHFHFSERPTLAIFPVHGQPALICPAFEATKTQHSPIAWQLFTYVDGQDPLEVFHAACHALQLDQKRLGVEVYKMRVLELRLLEKAAYALACEPADALIAQLRMIKDADEIAAIRRAIEITERALDDALDAVRAGMTERQIANLLTQALLQRGAEGLAFEPLIQSGPNAALPHATAGERVIQAGEVLLLDFGITLDGYNSDITRTFVVGHAPEEIKKIYELVKQANAAGRAAARPGATGQDVDHAARKVITEAGYGQYFTHRTGHGLGLEGHEPPYMVEGNATPLEVGNTLTIEPGIYVPGLGGVRIEDDMVITENGAESLTTYDRELKIIS